jgi:cytochrome c556
VKRIVRSLAIGLLAGAALLALAQGAAQADSADKVIAYRQLVMKSIGAHIGAIVSVVKGEVSYTGHVAAHASAIAAAARMIPDIFPEGTAEGETRAKPEIWQDWEKFTAAAGTVQREAAKLAEVAAGGDVAAIGAQLGALGNGCGGCHKPFRKEKR